MTVTLEQFRQQVYAEFGSRLEHATPELMRQFISRMYAELHASASAVSDQPFIIPEDSASSYEQVVTEFLANALTVNDDQAMILLWLFTAEIYFGGLGDRYTQDFAELFTTEISE